MGLLGLWKMLDGAKTYIGIVAEGFLLLLHHFGYIDADTLELGTIIVGTWTGVALRSAMTKIKPA